MSDELKVYKSAKRYLYECEYRIHINENQESGLLCKIISEGCGHTTAATYSMCARCQINNGVQDQEYLDKKMLMFQKARAADLFHGFYETEDLKEILKLYYKQYRKKKADRDDLRKIIEQNVRNKSITADEAKELVTTYMPDLINMD